MHSEREEFIHRVLKTTKEEDEEEEENDGHGGWQTDNRGGL